jgi:hypothetical protein
MSPCFNTRFLNEILDQIPGDPPSAIYELEEWYKNSRPINLVLPNWARAQLGKTLLADPFRPKNRTKRFKKMGFALKP